eukprot:scaffold34939_cov101-Isochrysis_galbana.AAC.1
MKKSDGARGIIRSFPPCHPLTKLCLSPQRKAAMAHGTSATPTPTPVFTPYPKPKTEPPSPIPHRLKVEQFHESLPHNPSTKPSPEPQPSPPQSRAVPCAPPLATCARWHRRDSG